MPFSAALLPRLRRMSGSRNGRARLTTTVLAAALAALLSRGPEDREIASVWQTAAAVGVWAFGSAAASRLPLWGFALAVLWLAWHAVLLGAVWTGGPVIALPVWGLLLGFLWKTAAEPVSEKGRGAPFYLWVFTAVAAGWITAGPCGFNHFTGWTGPLEIRGNLALGLLYAAAGVWLRPKLRRFLWIRKGPPPLAVFAGAAGVLGAVMFAGWRLDTPGTAGWTADFLRSLRSFSGLIWFWLGGMFALALLHPAEAGTRRFIRAFSLRRAVVVMPLAWCVATLAEWLVVRRGGGGLTPVPAALAELPAAASAHAWMGIVVLVTGAGFLWQGREGVRLLPRLNAVWLASFGALLAVTPALTAAAFPGIVPAPAVATLWPAVVVLAALLRGEPPPRTAGGIRPVMFEEEPEPGEGLTFHSTGLPLMFAALLAVEAGGGLAWDARACPAVLLGMLHLAPARAFYQWWRRGRPSGPPLTAGSQAWLGLAGVLTALPFLQRTADSPASLVAGPLLWLPVLLALRWRRPRLDMASGAAAGALLAGGMLAAWIAPGLLPPELPVLQFLNPSPALRDLAWNGPLRPVLEPPHFTLLLLMLCAGALLGGLIFRRPPPAGEIPVALPANAA